MSPKAVICILASRLFKMWRFSSLENRRGFETKLGCHWQSAWRNSEDICGGDSRQIDFYLFFFPAKNENFQLEREDDGAEDPRMCSPGLSGRS